MQSAFEIAGFSAYLSRLKVGGSVLLMVFSLAVALFSDASHQTYYKWIYSEHAVFIRWAVTGVGILLLLILLYLFCLSLLNVCIFKLSDGHVTVHKWKGVKFSLSEVDYVNTIVGGSYEVGVKGKRYNIPIIFCRDREDLIANLDYLNRMILSKRS